MALFSERNNYKPVKVDVQIEYLDDELRVHLWNTVFEYFVKDYIKEKNSGYTLEAKFLWSDFFIKSINQMPYYEGKYRNLIHELFLSDEWYLVLDFIEFIIPLVNDFDTQIRLIQTLNYYLEKDLSAYRIVDKKVVQITSQTEIATIETAINSEESSVSIHLKRALELLSDRQTPDYRNSIKESISAVEALCIEITNDMRATLGEALKHPKIKDNLHGSLTKGFSNLYGFTSNAEGIRHAIMDEPTLNQEDALFMLVTCSAFVNYLRGKIK